MSDLMSNRMMYVQVPIVLIKHIKHILNIRHAGVSILSDLSDLSVCLESRPPGEPNSMLIRRVRTVLVTGIARSSKSF